MVAVVYFTSGPLLDGNVPKWLAVTAAAVVMAPFIRLDRVAVYVGAFVMLAALSLAWSPDPAGGVAQLWKLAAIAVIALAARPDEKTLIAVAGVAGLSWIMPFGGGYGAGGFGNSNFETEWLIAAVPLCTVLAWRQGRWRIVGIIVLAIIVARLLVNPSKIEFFVAWLGAIFVLHRIRWYYGAAFVFLGMVNVAMLWPEAFGIADSVQSRAQLAAGTFFMWLDHPIFGTGLGGFDHLYPAYADGYRLLWDAPQFLGPHFYPAAPHNDWLSLLAGFGVVGVALALLVVMQIQNWSSCWANSLLCLGAAALIGFPLQTPATVLLAAVCFGSALPSAVPLSSSWRWPWQHKPGPSMPTKHSAGSGPTTS